MPLCDVITCWDQEGNASPEQSNRELGALMFLFALGWQGSLVVRA